MKEKPKRFTISLPPELEEQLQEAKKESFSHFSQREILEKLIRKGIREVEQGKKTSGFES